MLIKESASQEIVSIQSNINLCMECVDIVNKNIESVKSFILLAILLKSLLI